MGCTNQTAEQWSYGGRLISLGAGLPLEVSAMCIDRQCGSAMTAIHVGAMEIMCGYSDIVIAGGYEHMTHVPMGFNVKPNFKLLKEEKRFDWTIAMNMGLTAEKLAEETGISREEMDKWAYRSHMLAVKAYEEGFFKDEIIPVEVTLPDGWVPYEDVYGVVIFIIPRVGVVSLWLRRSHLAPIIIGALIVFMIILTFWETPEEKQKSKK